MVHEIETKREIFSACLRDFAGTRLFLKVFRLLLTGSCGKILSITGEKTGGDVV